jgi:hypothetical protein
VTAAVKPREARPRRGLWLNLLVAFEVVQGLIFISGGAVLVAVRNNTEVRVDLEGSATGVGAIGSFMTLFGVIHLLVAVGLFRRSEFIRSAFAALATVQAAIAVFALISRQGARLPGAVPFLSSMLVLWVLYGSTRTREFFDR